MLPPSLLVLIAWSYPLAFTLAVDALHPNRLDIINMDVHAPNTLIPRRTAVFFKAPNGHVLFAPLFHPLPS